MSNNRISRSFLFACALAALVAGAPARALAAIRYVNAARPDDFGNGLSWATAKRTLQAGLQTASGGDQIWVAAGVYKPDQGGGQTPGNRSATFQLKNNVAIYGGFAGAETSLSQRDVAANVTILSGDLSGNDVLIGCSADFHCASFGENCLDGFCNIADNNDENSLHVVRSNAVNGFLDGFTITSGNANGLFPDSQGGGLYITGSMPSFSNCTFTRNFAASNGGGAHNASGGGTFKRCTFNGNSAGNGGGGGLLNTGAGGDVIRCTFRGNVGKGVGGGAGGGLNIINSSNMDIVNCSFLGNDASNGGGMAISNTSTGTVVNCLFSGNTALRAGGLEISGSSTPTLSNCALVGNIALTGDGGGLYTSGSNPFIFNSIFWANSDTGGTDSSAQIHVFSGLPNVNYNIIQGGWVGGSANLSADPLLEDADGPDNVYGTIDDDVRIMAGSPAIDSGHTGALPADSTDLDGNGSTVGKTPLDLDENPRQADDPFVPDTGLTPYPIVDRGPYELQGANLIFVDASATGANNGSTWTDAFVHIQSAWQLANDVPSITEVWVADGTYMPDGGRTSIGGNHVNGTGNRSATIQLLSGVSFYGGFAGGESDLSQRDPALHDTIFSGDLLGNDAVVACTQDVPDCDFFGGRCVGNRCVLPDNNDENSYHVVTGSPADSTALLDGFTITAGRANGPPNLFDHLGAGMLNYSGSPRVNNCTFSGNTASSGGGIYNTNHSAATVTNCAFRGNVATAGGGGVSNEGAGNTTASNCTFEFNVATNGGGMANAQSSSRVSDCSFRGNRAGFQGGAIYSQGGSNPIISGCLFDKNRAGFGGGALANTGGTALIVNSVFSGNFGNPGGGILSQSTTNVVNSIFSANSTTERGGGLYHFANQSFTLNNCTFSGNIAGAEGGGVYNDGDNSNDLYNCVFWNNIDVGGMDASAQVHTTTGTLEFSYGILQGGWSGFGSNNLSSDPLFFDPDGVDNIVGTVDDNLRLQTGSPGINSGSNGLVPADTADLDGDGNTAEQTPVDLAGEPRFVAIVDRGAYESFPDCNNNGVDDAIDISDEGTSSDCTTNGKSGNGIPDECDIANCPGSGICVGGPNNGDSCLIDFHCNGGIGCFALPCNDCNLNGVPDGCDVFIGASQDSNSDGFPDECAFFTGLCTFPTREPHWTCTDNWELAGQYPDVDSADEISVSLPDGAVVVLDESVTIPNLWIQHGAELQLTTHDTLLDVDRAIQVDGTMTMESCKIAGNTPPRLTIGAGGKFQTTECTSAGPASTMTAAEIRIQSKHCPIFPLPPCRPGGSVELNESIVFTSAGDLIIDGSVGAGSCDSQPPPGEPTPPSLISRGSSSTIVGGTLHMLGAPHLNIESSVPMELGGNFENQSVRPDCFNWPGALRMNGSAQEFEVAATDIGPVSIGLRGGVDATEFTMGAVTIAEGASVTVRDSFDNNLSGQAPCSEAVYIGQLAVEAGASLTIENCRVYYATLSLDPSATVTTRGCGELLATPIAPPPDVQADASGINKSRFISFSVPAAQGGEETALRVKLVSLHHVVPPYSGAPSTPFTSFEGQVRWVGPPAQYVESTSTGVPLQAASLQCTPHYRDWSTVGLLHVTGSAIAPSSVYEVENISGLCMGAEEDCSAVSAPLTLVTTRWGDVETPYNPPSTTAQPDVGDISALVNKFRSAPGAPIKARALLAGADQFGNINIGPDLSFSHIAACVDAFRGQAYPHTIQACP